MTRPPAAAEAPEPPQARTVLCLYLAGNTPVSARAIVNTRRFCEEHLADRYELEIVDISLQPERVRSAQILAAPTLVKLHPLPMKKAIGDMSQTERLLQLFAIQPAPP